MFKIYVFRAFIGLQNGIKIRIVQAKKIVIRFAGATVTKLFHMTSGKASIISLAPGNPPRHPDLHC